jgi:hypothetical protein
VYILNHLGQAAAAFLLIELLVIILIFLAIAGVLAFGLRWARGKTSFAFGKANTYLGMGTRYLHTGTDYAALPFIKASGFAETIKVTAVAVRRLVLQARAARPAPTITAARPIEAEPAAEPESIVPLT